MLVLCRRLDESVMIGGDIKVIVTHVSNRFVRLGFNAPSQYPVYRKEIYDEIMLKLAAGEKLPEMKVRSKPTGTLVLGRKQDQTVIILKPGWMNGVKSATDLLAEGILVKITVVSIKGEKVRLAFGAGDDVTIHRLEVYEQIKAGKHV
jgi:carbon storage regulator